MSLSALSTLTIAAPGWVDKRELRVASVAASWRVNGIGQLSALLPVREAWLLGVDNYFDLWVRWDHPTMGAWAGVVKRTRVTLGESLELSCRSMIRRAKGVRTIRTYEQAMASAGALVWRALQDAPGEAPLFDVYAIDDAGPPISAEWRGDDRFQVIDRLARSSGNQYDVTIDDNNLTTFTFKEQAGEDKTGEVLLVEGYQITDADIVTDWDAIENSLLVVSADDDWETAPWTIVQAGDSIETYGRAEGTRRYYGMRNVGALASRGRVELDDTSLPNIPMTLRLRDTEPLLSEIRQGDSIRVWSASANGEYVLQVLQRAIDVDRGMAVLSGIAEVET